MKMLLVIDTSKMSAEFVSMQDISKEDIIKEINDYFNIDSAKRNAGKKTEIILARQFTIYFLRELLGLNSKVIKECLEYEPNSSIISVTLNKINEELFDNKELIYVRPYNNLIRIFGKYGIVLKPIILDRP